MGDPTKKQLTRRDFIKGTAAGAVVVTAAGALGSCGGNNNEEKAPWLPETWDEEADVVVVGYGVGGAVAAMEAFDAGASVILLEKQASPGGSTAISGGMFNLGGGTRLQTELGVEETADEFYAYLIAQGQDEAQEELQRVYADHSVETFAWLEDTLGLVFPRNKSDLEIGSCRPEEGGLGFLGNEWYPPILEQVGRAVHHAHYQTTAGAGFFAALKDQVDSRDITVKLETAAKGLVFDSVNKEVLGVRAEEGTTEIHIKANKAVILTAGGYGRNKEVVKSLPQNYRDYVLFRPAGNTGDGLVMAQEVGAFLFACDGADFLGHFGPSPSEWGIVGDEDPNEFTFIYVDRAGKRFVSEEYHLGIRALYWGRTGHVPDPATGDLNFRTTSLMSRDIGGWLIYDETTRAHLDIDTSVIAGPDGRDVLEVPEIGLSVATKTVSGNTIEELAAAVKAELDPLKGEGIDPVGLQETIDEWNANVSAATPADPVWNRRYGLIPIDTPPYYATFLWPFMLNETTGIKIDAEARVLSVRNEPISRLYAAGRNTGGQYGRIYTCGTALVSGIIMGKIAGINATAETAWE